MGAGAGVAQRDGIYASFRKCGKASRKMGLTGVAGVSTGSEGCSVAGGWARGAAESAGSTPSDTKPSGQPFSQFSEGVALPTPPLPALLCNGPEPPWPQGFDGPGGSQEKPWK